MKGLNRKAIGIDIGTTTISIVVLDVEAKKVVEVSTIQNESFIITGNDWERIQDTDIIQKKVIATLDEFVKKYPDVNAIGLTGQMHGILYVDQNGKAVSPLYTWQDGRGNVLKFEGKTLVQEIQDKYRINIAAGYGMVTHIYHMKTNTVPENSASFCTIGDYLGMLLTANKKPLMHSSNAASLGFFDVRNNCFRKDILVEIGISEDVLPAVTDEFAVIGTYKNIPVTVAIGDNQASFLGTVGVNENTVLLNVGTGGQISVLTEQYFEAPGIEARPFIKGNYLLTGSSLCGGRAYAMLEKFFETYMREATGSKKSQYQTMAKLAEKGSKEKNGMKITTTFKGTRVCPDATGWICNINEDNFTPEGMVFGVLQGMAQELYDMYQQICEGTSVKVSHLAASGNGLRKNPALQKIFRNLFEAELTIAPYEEEAACGAAMSSILNC